MRKKFEMSFSVFLTCDTDMPADEDSNEFWDSVDDLQEKIANEIRDLLKKGGYDWNLEVVPESWGEIK